MVKNKFPKKSIKLWYKKQKLSVSDSKEITVLKLIKIMKMSVKPIEKFNSSEKSFSK